MKEYTVNGKVIDITLENGKVVKASTKFIENMMNTLDIDMEDAVLTWLEDEEYLINDEQEELNKNAKGVVKLVAANKKKETKEKKSREKKANPVKEGLTDYLAEMLSKFDGTEDVVIENRGKLITFKIGEREFKLDLIEKRTKKVEKGV